MNGREPFRSAAEKLLRESGCTVRKWRAGPTGRAFAADDDWGIEVPEPRGPVSYGTFAHEVAHQMLHRHGSRPRWLEEIEAWEWALATFARFRLPGLARAERDAARALGYTYARLRRRSDVSAETLAAVEARMPAWVERPLDGWSAPADCDTVVA